MDTDTLPARAGPDEEYRRDAASRTADRTDSDYRTPAGEPPEDDTGPVTTQGLDPAVSGPHAGYDRYGRFDYRYWRCEACGLETTQDISDGCPRCPAAARDAEGTRDA